MNPAAYTAPATAQLDPVYKAQSNAVASQIPAINMLYEALGKGVDSRAKTATQNAFETASGRGLLYSTIPVDMQAGIEAGAINEKGELGAKQMGEIADVNTELAGIGVNRANAISQLVQALFGMDMQNQQFAQTQNTANQSLALQRQIADRDYQLSLQRLKRGI